MVEPASQKYCSLLFALRLGSFLFRPCIAETSFDKSSFETHGRQTARIYATHVLILKLDVPFAFLNFDDFLTSCHYFRFSLLASLIPPLCFYYRLCFSALVSRLLSGIGCC